MCFVIHKEPLDLWYILVSWSCERCISVNFPHILDRFTQNLFTCKFTLLNYCHLLIAWRSWLCGWYSKTWIKATFFKCKTHFFVQHAGNRIWGLWNFRIFLEQHAPRPPPPLLEKGDLWPPVDRVAWLLESNLLATSIFIETSVLPN